MKDVNVLVVVIGVRYLDFL